MSDDHSEVVPPLPIPNRTVKRLSADDSADYLCESRSSSDSSKSKKPKVTSWAFCFSAMAFRGLDLTTAATALNTAPAQSAHPLVSHL